MDEVSLVAETGAGLVAVVVSGYRCRWLYVAEKSGNVRCERFELDMTTGQCICSWVFGEK